MRPLFWEWQHFSFEEVFHNNLHVDEVVSGKLENIAVTLDKLTMLRGRIKSPIHITSFFRDSVKNKKVGGVKGSYHTQGMAVDILIPAARQHLVAKQALDLFNGIIIYPDRGFIHLDTRPEEKRFWGQNTGGVLVPVDFGKF